MIKTLRNLFKQDKEKFVVPKSVQAVIPIKTIWEDGIFLVGKNKYAKTFKFEDINYAVASREDKEAMFLEYSELLNALDSGATTKITMPVWELTLSGISQGSAQNAPSLTQKKSSVSSTISTAQARKRHSALIWCRV